MMIAEKKADFMAKRKIADDEFPIVVTKGE
jgi:hypothetical protein